MTTAPSGFWNVSSCVLRTQGCMSMHAEKKILMLPSRSYLRNFVKKYESSFGFNSSVFSGIAKNTEQMDEFLRHSGLITDEMKLAKNFGVAQGTGKIDDFVDLGVFIPDNEKTVP